MEVLWWWVCLTTILFGASQAVDLHLEGQTDSVFFFQQSFGSSQQPLLKFPPVHSPSNGNISSSAPESRPLLRERLALISQSGQQGRIRVTYGPFEAKQSLPTKFLSLVDQQDNNNSSSSTGSSDIQATLMDISAHVVNGDQGLRRESPVLRVLFHSGRHFHSLSPGAATGDRDETGDDETAEDTDEGEREDQEEERDAETWDENLHESSRLMETCISLRVYNPSGVGSALTATCTPRGLEGVCLASLTLPYDWWASSPISPTFPSLSPGVLVHNLQQQPASVTAKPTKALRNLVELSYSVYQTKAGQCDEENRSSASVAGQPVPPDSRGHHQLGRLKNPLRHQQTKRPRALPSSRFPPPSAILIQSARSIGSLRLLPNVYAPRDLLVHEEAVSLSPTLRFIASAAPLYPHSRFYVTVLLDTTGSSRDEPYAVVVRAKVKHGLKIISTQTSNPAWSLSFEVNAKHIAAAVTAVRNFSVPTSSNSNQKSQEMFTWLLAVNEDQHKDLSSDFGIEGVRALWSWTIRSHSTAGHKDGADEVKGKLTSRFEVLKDEVQSVFPIIKRRDLVNTAILTSRQVSEPLRIFMVTQAGKVADVTLQASCSSADESVLKVSSSCTSVYLDGSEVRGSTNATLVARYGNVESTSSLTVWVPELPLDIQMDDVKLNQINGWKVPPSTGSQQCRLRYQQTSFEVFARFYAEDHDSGRVSYLISRKTYLLITELVRKTMRVSDPRIAALRGAAHVEGLKPGKTELQVLSPMSGQVIAAREVRVTGDRVDATELSVRLITGLSLSVTTDPDLDSCLVAQVDAQQRLHAKYQEAILDLALHFSDGTTMPLRLTERSHYTLTIDSHNASILALTSPIRATIPRVLALGEGQAVISLSFGAVPICTNPNPQETAAAVHSLASAVTSIQVALTGHPISSVVQNDARTESSSQQSYTPSSNNNNNNNQVIGEAVRRNKIMVAPMASGGGRSSQQQPNNQGQLTFSKPGSTEFGVSENQLSLKDDSNAVMTSGRASDHPTSYSNQPSWTSSNGLGGGAGGTGWHISPLEMGLYALLAVFCAAISVFVGTCVIYASRARKSVTLQQPPPPPPAFQSDLASSTPTVLKAPTLFWNRLKKMNQKNVQVEAEDCQEEDGECGFGDIYEEQQRTDKGWIWLGRSTLPESETAASVSPPPPPPLAADEPVISISASNKRLSGISYTGSEVSVLITSRPEGNRLAYKAQLCFEPLTDDISVLTPVDNNWSSVDSTTFTKNSPINITANRLVAELGLENDDDDEEEEPCAVLAEVTRRPKSHRRAAQRVSEQDTRRYARSWLMAGEAVPRDFNSNPSPTLGQRLVEEVQQEKMTVAKDQEDDYNLATFLRHGSPDIKQANIIENPRCSTSSPVGVAIGVDDVTDADSENITLPPDSEDANAAAVDYDRIISYLGILKETST